MANNLTGNPKYIDTAASSTITGTNRVHLIQWIDDAMDIADGDDLSITMNGVTLAIKRLLGSDVGHQDNVIYQAGPFSPPIPLTDFVCNVIDHGVLLVWLA